MKKEGFKISQYACAVLLIVSSIALVAYQVVHIDDVAGGLLVYYDFVVVHRQLFLVFICRFGNNTYLCSGITNK